MLFVFSVAFGAQENSAMANNNARALAYATEVGKLDRADWLWQNNFTSTNGAPSVTYLANNDTLGGKSCILADDFLIPSGESWAVDSLFLFLFWNKKKADLYQVILYADAGGIPNEASILKNFTFTANCPNQLTIYQIKVDVKNQNIVLTEGNYWISVTGVYNTATWAVDSCLTFWQFKDTLIEPYQGQCMDSVGICYPTTYPTSWMPIWFNGMNQYSSFKFFLKGTRTSPIHNINRPKTVVSAIAYPNPASENITFTMNNDAIKYIEIYDAKGKLMQTHAVKSDKKKVHLRTFNNGVYMYQLLDASKRNLDRGKFSVSK